MKHTGKKFTQKFQTDGFRSRKQAKKLQPRNLTHLEHIKRQGAGSGSHGDKKKQANKTACRGKIDKRTFSVLD